MYAFALHIKSIINTCIQYVHTSVFLALLIYVLAVTLIENSLVHV